MKKLLMGNEAVARGLYEAGVKVVSSYPGTPSTEITEFAAKYDDFHSEWAPNEKVACETAIGASLAGARSFCAMKHVGLNVAADPLYTASYIGVSGGFVLAVADDPGMHSSQNEQDSRHHAIASKVPMLEPADSSECLNFTKLAYEISEKYDTPVIIRLTTRISHSRSVCELSERADIPNIEYAKNTAKNVMLPAFARKKHVIVEERTVKLTEYAEASDINKVEMGGDIGIITSGNCYQYSKEALGDKASYLKLGMVNPLPVKLIKDFAAKFDKVYVIEELDDIIETHCKKNGINVIGKEIFGFVGEISQAIIREKLLGEVLPCNALNEELPVRPPVMCCGCPHRGLFYALKKKNVFVSGDIGCYTLGASAPLGMMDTCICMGASISSLHGRNLALGSEAEKKSVAVIGDSTFIHTGINSLINIAYNRSNSTVIILDNSITGMTGHQQNPSTGITLKGDATAAVSIEKVCEAIGIRRITVVDPYDLKALDKALTEELNAEEPSVIISRRPCALLKTVKYKPALSVNPDLCKSCKACMKLGCPAISFKDGKAVIDRTQCVGCGLCKGLCAFKAIN